MKELIKKLEQYDLYYGSFDLFSQTDYHRDFLLYLYTVDLIKIEMKLIGVVSMNYTSRLVKEGFSLDEKYLIENLGPPYHAWHWGIKSFEILNWKVEDDTKDLNKIQEDYLFKLYKITFKVSTSDISFIFHDLEVKEVNS